MWTSGRYISDRSRSNQLTRLVLTCFLLTAFVVRIPALLAASRMVSDSAASLGGAHRPDLDCGALLVAGVGAFLLFVRPAGGVLNLTAAAYGIGLALVFNDFGAWLDTAGWHRVGFDLVVIVVAGLVLAVAAPRLRHFHPYHWGIGALLVIALGLYGGLLVRSAQGPGRSGGSEVLSSQPAAPR